MNIVTSIVYDNPKISVVSIEENECKPHSASLKYLFHTDCECRRFVGNLNLCNCVKCELIFANFIRKHVTSCDFRTNCKFIGSVQVHNRVMQSRYQSKIPNLFLMFKIVKGSVGFHFNK